MIRRFLVSQSAPLSAFLSTLALALALALALPLGVSILGSGCSQRPVGGGGGADGGADAGADAGLPTQCVDLWDCNPGVSCGELVICQDGQCRPDLGHVIVPCVAGECTAHADCVVARPMSCCWGCPRVASRQALAEDPELECFYEDGYPPDTIPMACDMDCAYCEDCAPQPLGARCDEGLCVATDMGCPGLTEPAPPAATTQEIQQSAASLEGERRLVRGVVLPEEGSCDGEGCRTLYRSLLNGVVRLDGFQCDLPVGVTGDECRANLTGNALQPGGWYELEGVVHPPPNAWEEPYLEVSGTRVVEPEGLGGHYRVTITDIQSDVADPTCTPSPWSIGDTLDLYIGRSGPQVRVAAPALHCEANLSGGFDAGDSGPFTAWPPIDCDWCDFYINGTPTASGDALTGQYTSQVGPCTHVLHFNGPRSL